MKRYRERTENPSVRNLMTLLMEQHFPMTIPSPDRRFYEQLLPPALFACMQYPKDSGKSSYATWLHTGNPAANKRREEMDAVLRGGRGKGAREAAHAKELFAQTAARLRRMLAEDAGRSAGRIFLEVIKEADCLPFAAADEENLRTCQAYLRYFNEQDTAYALAALILLLLLSEPYAAGMMRLVFFGTPTEESFEGALLAFECGNTKEAQRLFEGVIADKNAGREQMIKSLFLLGEILRAGEGKAADFARARSLCRRALSLSGDTDADSAYALFCMDRAGEGASQTAVEDTRRYLDIAVEQNHREALLDKADLYLRGDRALGIRKDARRALALYERGRDSFPKDALFSYGCGLAAEAKGDTERAKKAYGEALRKGYAPANARLLGLEMTGTLAPVAQSKRKRGALPARLLVTNCDNAMTRAFRFPDGDAPQLGLSVRDGALNDFFSKLLSDANHPPAERALFVFLLFDESTDTNIEDACQVVRNLNAAGVCMPMRRFLSDSVRIFVRTEAPEAVSSAMIDRLNALYESSIGLGQPAADYHIRLCCPERDASLELLEMLPAPPPSGMGTPAHTGGIVLFGDGRTAARLARDLTAVSPFRTAEGSRLPVTIAGENTEGVRRLLAQDAPALLSEDGAVRTELFPLTDEELCLLLASGSMQQESPAAQILRGAYAFVLCGEKDERNAQLALLLRQSLYRERPTPAGAKTYVAARIGSGTFNRHFSGVRLSERDAASWYNDYSITLFGNTETLYSEARLLHARCEKRAFELHRSYYAKEEGLRALGDYRSRFYNRDSSLMSVLGARFLAALFGFDIEREAEAFAGWLLDEGNLEEAARCEHERWCAMMKTRGFMRASVAQAEQYMKAGAPSHQLRIAKLHPFLCPWEELDGVLKHFHRRMRLLTPGYAETDVKETNRRMVRAYAALYGAGGES